MMIEFYYYETRKGQIVVYQKIDGNVTEVPIGESLALALDNHLNAFVRAGATVVDCDSKWVRASDIPLPGQKKRTRVRLVARVCCSQGDAADILVNLKANMLL